MYLKNEYMNWTDFFNADSEAIISGETNKISYSLNAGGPLELYLFFFSVLTPSDESDVFIADLS